MSYKANTECMWNINLAVGKTITLKFTDFDLEGKDIWFRCLDNIVVYDINSLTNKLIKKYGKFVEVFTKTTAHTFMALLIQSKIKVPHFNFNLN